MRFATIEAFSESLLSRWKELHPEFKKSKPDEPERPKPGKVPFDLLSSPGLDAITNLFSGFLKTGENKINLSDDFLNRVKDTLKPPVEWVGNLAVGENARLHGWWDILFPNGHASISYFGPFARKRAVEKAESLKGEYE